MIIRQSQIHHGPRHHIPLLIHYSPHLGGMHTQNGALRLIDNRRTHQRTKHPSIRNGKRSPCHIINRQRPILRLLSKQGNSTFHIGKSHELRIPQNRHHQPIRTRHRHTNIAIITVYNLLRFIVNIRINRRNFLQCTRTCLDKHTHKTKFDTVLLGKVVFVPVTHFHKVTHVDFLEGREHGCGILRFFETGGDALTHARHFGAAFGTVS
mmetsp:Transcript_1950/g.4297  ORF Transcript_1950/g.4297 Transcript_1950/m.4297 type:complete len:209 (+) Transcript_1950:361-987(+)